MILTTKEMLELSDRQSKFTTKALEELFQISAPDVVFYLGAAHALKALQDSVKYAETEAQFVDLIVQNLSLMLSASCFEIKRNLGADGYGAFMANFSYQNPLLVRREGNC